jgi:hypothetical protein
MKTMSEHHDHRDDCPFKFATLDVCDCVEKNMLDRIEALEAKLAKAVEALDMLVRDCEADYPPSHGAIKHFAIATLAEIKGESHDRA